VVQAKHFPGICPNELTKNKVQINAANFSVHSEYNFPVNDISNATRSGNTAHRFLKLCLGTNTIFNEQDENEEGVSLK
jgi:hypothetical protein